MRKAGRMLCARVWYKIGVGVVSVCKLVKLSRVKGRGVCQCWRPLGGGSWERVAKAKFCDWKVVKCRE